jgi:hypothetical protein
MRVKEAGYRQAEIMTIMMHEAFESGADWVIPLDLDEFIPFSTRAGLEDFLTSLSGFDYATWSWLNVVPEQIGARDMFRKRFLTKNMGEKYTKVLISKSAYLKDRSISLSQGSHSIVSSEKLLGVEEKTKRLIHIPIHGRDHYTQKMLLGALRMKESGLGQLGAHWSEHAGMVSRSKELPNEKLLELGMCYPDVDSENGSKIQYLDFDFPYLENAVYEDEQPSAIAALASNFAQLLASGDGIRHLEVVRSNRDLGILDGESNLTHVHDEFSKGKRIAESAFLIPPVLPPTGWWGHIPFLFAIFEATRPRNFVELGVHYGASFIAASSATAQLGLSTKLFGIDTWEGDNHVGSYEGDRLMESVRAWGETLGVDYKLIRKRFDQAVRDFDDASVELLHIDGFHTYEAVKADFQTWLPKMAPNGIVLFHDVYETKEDFGVHVLWQELKAQYRTFDFSHSHGLGVLMLDKHDNRLEVFEALSASESGSGFLSGMFENIAHRMVSMVPKSDEVKSKSTILSKAVDATRKLLRIRGHQS